MCDLDISERSKPQDGKINFAKFSPQHKIELRVATIPTNNGLEDVVLRLLASAQADPDRQASDRARTWRCRRGRAALRHGAVRRPHRLGQDDDAALGAQPHQRAGAQDLDRRGSGRDHPAGPAPGAGEPEDRLDLRQGAARLHARRPDVIMLGEIRDNETAQMAIEASLTGHLVLSTLHTNSAPRP
jgi:hypothetical protein